MLTGNILNKDIHLGIPLTYWGTIWFFIFNYLCLMSLIAHWRAAWADPGSIPKMKVRKISI